MNKVEIFRLWSDQPGYGWALYQNDNQVGYSPTSPTVREYATWERAAAAAKRYAKRFGYGRVDTVRLLAVQSGIAKE